MIKFRAKSLKTGKWVEGDLAYAARKNKDLEAVPLIVHHFIQGGMVWIGERVFVDESTIERIEV